MGGRVPAPDGCLQARDRDAGSALTVRRERVSGHRRHRERKQQMENWRPRVSALIVGAALMMRVDTPFRIFGYPGLPTIFFLLAALAGLILVASILLTDEKPKKKTGEE